MSATTQYVRYRDDIEVIQPDEEHIIRQIVESMGRVNRKVYDRHRHAIRDAHAKSHGIVTGTLEVVVYRSFCKFRFARGLLGGERRRIAPEVTAQQAARRWV